MATILAFPEMQVPERKRAPRRSRSSAEIILFPGIRYERWGDHPSESDARSPAIVRDRLQLIE